MTCLACSKGRREWSTARSRWLGQELRDKRVCARLSVAEVAGRLEWTEQALTTLEDGERVVDDIELAEVLAVYRTKAKESRRMVYFQRECDQNTWLQSLHGCPALRVRTPALEEFRATGIVGYDSTLIPGPLRTDGYLQALVGLDQPPGRRENLARVNSVFYLDEHAPARVVGDAEVMREQITFLLDGPATTLIVPSDAQGLCEAFTFLDNASSKPVVHLEMPTANMFFEDPDDVDLYRRVLARLADVARNTERSRRLLLDWAEKYDA